MLQRRFSCILVLVRRVSRVRREIFSCGNMTHSKLVLPIGSKFMVRSRRWVGGCRTALPTTSPPPTVMVEHGIGPTGVPLRSRFAFSSIAYARAVKRVRRRTKIPLMLRRRDLRMQQRG